jgi:hypothetical protein
MWVLIILGGGILVTVLGPFSITGFSDFDWILTSSLKAVIAIILVIMWILVLSKIKNWIFRKEMKY